MFRCHRVDEPSHHELDFTPQQLSLVGLRVLVQGVLEDERLPAKEAHGWAFAAVGCQVLGEVALLKQASVCGWHTVWVRQIAVAMPG